jgi:hypothetical protein
MLIELELCADMMCKTDMSEGEVGGTSDDNEEC